MNRKSTVLIGLVAGTAIIAVLVVQSARQSRRPATEHQQTTWEGQWEVPIIEGDKQVRSFRLAKNKHLRIRLNDAVWEFGEGEEVKVQWEPGKVFINNIEVLPYPDERVVLSADEVTKRYGDIPAVKQYIAEHRGEDSEDEVATRAVESWYAKVDEVIRQASQRYKEMLGTSLPQVAAEAATEVIRASGLADSVAVRRDSPPESQAQELDVIWRGQRGAPGAIVGVSLRSETSEMPPPTVTAKRLFKQLTDMLELLTYGENELAVRYEGGSVFLQGKVLSTSKRGES